MDCIFCQIVQGCRPAAKILENENVLAFLDIAPVAFGHALVVPKKHYARLEDIPIDELSAVISVVQKIGPAVQAAAAAAGYNVSLNNGPAAGQVVPHLHFHLIPRRTGDGLQLWPQNRYDEGGLEKMAQAISAAIG